MDTRMSTPVMCTAHVTRKLTFPDLDIQTNQELVRERSDHQGQEMESSSLQWLSSKKGSRVSGGPWDFLAFWA